MTDRRRNFFVLLAVAALLAGSAALIVIKKTRLGLDLKGGVELVYQAKPTKQSQVTQDSLNRAIDIMRQRVDQLGVSEPEIVRLGDNQVQVGLPDVKNAQRAEQQVGKVAQLFFYDWEPNVIGPNGKPDPQNANVTGGPAAGQVGSLTYYDAVLRASKRPRIDRPNTTTNGVFYLVDDKTKQVLRGPEETKRDLTADRGTPPGSRVVKVNEGTVVVQQEPPSSSAKRPNRWYVLNDDPALNGTDIKNPEQNVDNSPGGSGGPIVTFSFTSKGRKIWQNVTREIAQRGAANALPGTPSAQQNQHFAVVLDNQLITTPFIDFTGNPDGIDGVNGSQIEGGFTIQSAQDLANQLKTGALPLKLKLISVSQVSATLGKQALHQGLIAGLAGFLVVALFLVAFYRVLGLIAVGALLVYGVYFYALIKLIPITLTLPGLAGLILTIGVAADANIVIFERVKEEARGGRSMASAIATGYKKGFAAIVDANVVTFMTAFILFILATAGVKGFAFTLGIGTLTSLFTAVLATSAILGTISRSRAISSPRSLGAHVTRAHRRFDFMGNSKWFFSFSGVILLIGALAIGGNGLKFGIDFESGTRIRAALVKPTDENGVRTVVQAAGVTSPEIQRVTDKALGPNAFQISTSSLQPDQVSKVTNALDSRYGIRGSPNTQSVGPTFGQTVARSAIIAIIASILVISVYIALRFDWKYAVPVLIALMHDLLITAGVYSLTGREVTAATVAALLTILGYSLYDTIIVFDRVRENVPRMPRAAFSQIVNRAMSEVLTRSLATSFCTLLPVAALLLFGGATLKDFAFALLVGVASGAYSSVFIAAPVLTHWKERESVYARRAARIRAEFGAVPAYATAGAGGGPDVEPEERKRPSRRLTAPDEPGAISAGEFQELVRDLPIGDGDGGNGGTGRKAATTSTRVRAADADPDDVVMPKSKADGPPKPPKDRRPRNRKHGRPR